MIAALRPFCCHTAMASFSIDQHEREEPATPAIEVESELGEVPMQSPPLNDRHLEHDDVPLAPRSAAEGGRSGGPARDLDDMFDHRGGTRPMDSPIRSARPPRFKNNQVARSRPSIGRRMFRALTRVTIAVLIGVGATFVWESHGDKAKATVGILAPSLGWLLPDSTTTSAAGAATSRELVQQLAPIARDLAAVRRSMEQLAVKQEQMDQNIVTLQAIEQEIRQKVMSSPPPSRAAPAQPKPPQPAAQSSSAPPPPPSAGPPLR